MPAPAWWIASATLAAAIAVAAYRAGSLSRSGAIAATAIGAVTFATSARWGAFLVAWFVVTSALSRLGADRKARHVGAIVAKGGPRDALQVLANGGVFATAVGLTLLGPDTRGALATAAAAALAAAGADTWATEVGTWWRGGAWSLRTGTRVPAGTSGAVTWAGSIALAAGAAVWAATARLLDLVPDGASGAVFLGALAGAWLDTLLGAWAQARRHCPACVADTEREVHVCGTATTHVGGLAWLGNDVVNVAATLAGAAVAWGLVR